MAFAGMGGGAGLAGADVGADTGTFACPLPRKLDFGSCTTHFLGQGWSALSRSFSSRLINNGASGPLHSAIVVCQFLMTWMLLWSHSISPSEHCLDAVNSSASLLSAFNKNSALASTFNAVLVDATVAILSFRILRCSSMAFTTAGK